MRIISAAVIAQLNSGTCRPIDMVRIDYDSGVVAAHSGVGTITYGGVDYLGVGTLGSISNISENTELSAAGVTLTLSGVDPALVAIALAEPYQGRICTISRGFLNASYQLILDPIIIFVGRLDTQSIMLGANSQIEVVVENLTADWNRATIRRFNNQDQQTRFPGDKGLEFVTQATEKPVYWGVKFDG